MLGSRHYIWLWVFGFLLLQYPAMGQRDQLISLHLVNVTFTQFVKEVENKSTCHFYYDPAEIADLHITINSDKLSIADLLQKVFQNTGLQYAVDVAGRIFITKQKQIQTTLFPEFFDRKKIAKDTLHEPAIVLSGANAEKEKLNVSLEKKLFEIGVKTNTLTKGNAVLVGYVRDIKSGEALSGASVYIDSPAIKTVTDQFGYYTITLPKGRHVIRINSLGMKDTQRQLVLYSNGKLNIELEDYVASLKAVTVSTEKRYNTRSTQMGVDKVNIRTIKQVPTVLGESDILRVVLTLPGVTSVGEASTGFNVRGEIGRAHV